MLRFALKFSTNIQNIGYARAVANPVFIRCLGLRVAPPSENVPTMSEIKMEIMNRLGLEPGYHPIPKSREHLLQYQPKIENLPARSMNDSFTSAMVPLSTDKTLQDKYVSVLGHVRLGRLMEDMDLFAVWVCHQHIKMENLPKGVHLPYTFVTILVDKISFTDVITKSTEDVRISGHVSWVGKTSLEIVVWLEQKEGDVYKRITRALFLMAARNATNTAACPVNPLIPSTDEEKQILALGEQRKKDRHAIQALSIFKVEPNDFEQTLMYELFKRTTPPNTLELNKRFLPSNSKWMAESFAVNTMASFPENRNAHNRVFGGFLMRSALEISWVAACIYCKSRPRLVTISDISFEHPVSVSSILKITAYVVFTEVNYLQLMTIADIIDATTGDQLTSNVFYFTYKSKEQIPTVLPRSYHEAMWYIQGRRKFKNALGLQ